MLEGFRETEEAKEAALISYSSFQLAVVILSK